MKSHAWSRRVLVVGATALVVILFVRVATGGPPRKVSVPYDWSHRHLVFSQPASVEQAAKLRQEPRYWQQLLRRNAESRSHANGFAVGTIPDNVPSEFDQKLNKSPFHRDWAESLGPGASTGNTTYSQFPAKFTFDISPGSETCSDYVVFPTNVPGVTGTSEASPGQSSVIAFQNLYAGTNGACGPAPTVAWAYNTNAAGDVTGVVNGSPVLSFDGTKVGFVESKPGGSVLHLLQYSLGDGVDINGVAVAVPPTHLLTSGGWSSCPNDGSSCMISLTFTAGTVSNSSPFYDFGFDNLYVGDDDGVLHKFTGVFGGTPAEVTTGGWPITVNSGAILSPPVFDPSSNNAFVTDSSGQLSFVRDVGSTTGSCAVGSPPCLGSPSIAVAAGHPVIDAPLVDPSTEKVFVFVGNNGAASPRANVVQASTALSGVVTLSVGAAGAPLHTGAFDNTYLNSAPGSTSGFLYVCAKGAVDRPTLRRISFLPDGTVNTVNLNVLQVGNVTGAAGQCSPVTEIFNSPTDFLFFSVQSGGLGTCAGGGCVMSATVTGGTFPGSIAARLAEAGGTSGIVIDNIGNFGQDSSLYFTRLGQSMLSTCGGSGSTLVGCAVKLTQSGLN